MLYRADAPGSLMLLGEYAVLHGKTAVVVAVDKRVTVTIRPRDDNKIHIDSERFGAWATDISRLAITAPYHFVTACLLQYKNKMPSGCDIDITAEFSDQVGLGSSAAVTVATLAALGAWHKSSLASNLLLCEARTIIRQVQGVGSGADVAASVMGGIVAYNAEPLSVEKFELNLPLTVIYSGAKTTTVTAIQRVQEHFAASPDLYESLCNAIHQCANQGVHSLHEQNWQELGMAMNTQQGLMQALGVSTPLLDELIAQLHLQPNIQGAKISGSGLGDCVIGLGTADMVGVQQIKVNVGREGVTVHEQT